MIYEELELKISDKCTGKEWENAPKLCVYIPSNSPEIEMGRKRTTILICPGGAYEMTSDREAEPVAFRLMAEGFNVCVLRYSVKTATFPRALCEAATAMAMIRAHEEAWNVDVNKVIIGGFSAGGHLACSLATLWHTDFLEVQTGLSKEQYKPNGVMLAYPVISVGECAHRGSFQNLLQGDDTYSNMVSLENNVTEYMPKTFMWHTYDDVVVPVENSFLLANAMKKHNIPLELHIYPEGPHGLSLANVQVAKDPMDQYVNEHCQSWMPLFVTWLKEL